MSYICMKLGLFKVYKSSLASPLIHRFAPPSPMLMNLWVLQWEARMFWDHPRWLSRLSNYLLPILTSIPVNRISTLWRRPVEVTRLFHHLHLHQNLTINPPARMWNRYFFVSGLPPWNCSRLWSSLSSLCLVLWFLSWHLVHIYACMRADQRAWIGIQDAVLCLI